MYRNVNVAKVTYRDCKSSTSFFVFKFSLVVLVLVFIYSYDNYFSFLFSFSLQEDFSFSFSFRQRKHLIFLNDNFSFSFRWQKQHHKYMMMMIMMMMMMIITMKWVKNDKCLLPAVHVSRFLSLGAMHLKVECFRVVLLWRLDGIVVAQKVEQVFSCFHGNCQSWQKHIMIHKHRFSHLLRHLARKYTASQKTPPYFISRSLVKHCLQVNIPQKYSRQKLLKSVNIWPSYSW